MYRYLMGSGRDKIPQIVEKKLGRHWYTGMARALSKTDMGSNFVADKVLERTLPKVEGNTNLARTFIAAGGQV